ncbi:MAG: thermonuclease family protein [Neisseria sp.]|nr:thermonuclease family protein [Neisseria sp.]
MPSQKKIWLAGAAVLFSLLGLPEGSPVRRMAAEIINVVSGGKAARAEKGGQYGGVVVDVHDGDTVRVKDGDGREHKIRLAYIDAPELGQAFGKDSRDLLRGLVLEKDITVRVSDIDRYGREVAQLEAGGRNINLEQIENGAAWHYASIAKRQQDRSSFDRYARAEAQAKAARRGLWAGKNPVAPWTFRKQKKAR